MSEPREFAAQAPAKINLWLAIRGRRDDGYHDLATVMMALGFGDELRVRAVDAPGVTLTLQGPAATADIPVDSRNLVVRAAESVRARLRDASGSEPAGLAFSLEKHVPSQAGLGGGSGDAAIALRLAEAALGGDGGDAWRRARLAELGADCVFFHDVGPSAVALCEGIGERVTVYPGSPPAWSVALLVPEARCPTPDVFGALARSARVAVGEPPGPDALELSAADLRPQMATDLEPAALAAVPELARWRALLDDRGAGHFRLSGSGSTWFGVFDEPGEAIAEVARLERLAGEAGLGLRLARVASALGNPPA